MARKATKTPEEQIEALQRERVKLAGERHALQAELAEAQAIVAAFPDERQRALVDADRGRDDRVQAVEARAQQAQAVVADRSARIKAKEVAEAEIGEEVQEIRSTDAGLAHFTLRAEEASRAAEAARAAAEEACSALQVAWRDAYSQWAQLRRDHKHTGREEGAPREVPLPDFPGPIGSMSAHHAPWPGGREAHWREQHARKTSLSPSEVRGQLAGREPEPPLLEVL